MYIYKYIYKFLYIKKCLLACSWVSVCAYASVLCACVCVICTYYRMCICYKV